MTTKANIMKTILVCIGLPIFSFGIIFASVLCLCFPWLISGIIILCLCSVLIKLFWAIVKKRYREKSLRLAIRFLYIPIGIWVISFLLPFACGLFGFFWETDSRVFQDIEFPLSIPKGIVVNSNKEIICANPFYQRLQVYDFNGNFKKSWFAKIPIHSEQEFLLSLIDDNINLVAYGRSVLYNCDGSIIKTEEIPREYVNSIKYKNINVFKSKLEQTYTLENRFLFPKVVCYEKTKLPIEIQLDKWSMFLLKGPWQAFILFFAFLVLSGFLEKMLKIVQSPSKHTALSTSKTHPGD